MKKTFVRIIDDEEINIDGAQDFIDDNGIRHPRNVLWLWSDDELWDVLHIRVDWVEEVDPAYGLENDPIMVPKPPKAPEPVKPPDEPLPPGPPAPPAPLPQEEPLTGNVRIPNRVLKEIEDAGVELDDDTVAKLEVLFHTDAQISHLVAYGGIAIRTLHIEKKGGFHQGHRHNYDHLTNVVRGAVLCEVDGAAPKKYVAPCQITIAADHWHKFTALEDDVVYQCVYRQPDRQDLYTTDHTPYGLAPYTSGELIEKLKTVDNPCAHCDCDKSDGEIE